MTNTIIIKKLLLVFAIVILGFEQSLPAEIQIGRYRTDRLRKIAEYTGLTSIADTLEDGNYRGIFKWNDYSLNVTVRGGEVSHIGIQLFTDTDRKLLTESSVYDFLERYLLENRLGKVAKEFGENIHLGDGVVVECGAFKNLHRVCGDTTLIFSMLFDNNRKFYVSWSSGDTDIFRMSFPASNRLLCGYTLDEGEQKLSAKIKRADSKARISMNIDRLDLTECDTTLGHYHIKKGDFCVPPIINNDRYYFLRDTIPEMLYGTSYPVESLANLLISGEIENHFIAKVSMMRYGGRLEEFCVPLNSLINFFIDEEGCVPYFGLKGFYPGKNILTALYEMVNVSNGYEHLMSVRLNISDLAEKEGEIEIRLTPYLPTHDIQTLYKN